MFVCGPFLTCGLEVSGCCWFTGVIFGQRPGKCVLCCALGPVYLDAFHNAPSLCCGTVLWVAPVSHVGEQANQTKEQYLAYHLSFTLGFKETSATTKKKTSMEIKNMEKGTNVHCCKRRNAQSPQ